MLCCSLSVISDSSSILSLLVIIVKYFFSFFLIKFRADFRPEHLVFSLRKLPEFPTACLCYHLLGGLSRGFSQIGEDFWLGRAGRAEAWRCPCCNPKWGSTRRSLPTTGCLGLASCPPVSPRAPRADWRSARPARPSGRTPAGHPQQAFCT